MASIDIIMIAIVGGGAALIAWQAGWLCKFNSALCPSGGGGGSDFGDLFVPDSPIAGRPFQTKIAPMHAPTEDSLVPVSPVAGRPYQKKVGPIHAPGARGISAYADDDDGGMQRIRFSNGAEIIDFG